MYIYIYFLACHPICQINSGFLGEPQRNCYGMATAGPGPLSIPCYDSLSLVVRECTIHIYSFCLIINIVLFIDSHYQTIEMRKIMNQN